MRRLQLSLPSPAMCVALLALFVAMGGSAYAAKKITAKNIGTGAVGTRAVKNGSLAGTDIRGNSLGPGTIAEQSLDTRKFKTVPSAKVAGTVVKNAIGASELGNVTRRFGGERPIANGQVGITDAGCAKGEIALGGGGRWDAQVPGLSIQSSFADTDSGWRAVAQNGSGTPHKFQAFAMCLAP